VASFALLVPLVFPQCGLFLQKWLLSPRVQPQTNLCTETIAGHITSVLFRVNSPPFPPSLPPSSSPSLPSTFPPSTSLCLSLYLSFSLSLSVSLSVSVFLSLLWFKGHSKREQPSAIEEESLTSPGLRFPDIQNVCILSVRSIPVWQHKRSWLIVFTVFQKSKCNLVGLPNFSTLQQTFVICEVQARTQLQKEITRGISSCFKWACGFVLAWIPVYPEVRVARRLQVGHTHGEPRDLKRTWTRRFIMAWLVTVKKIKITQSFMSRK